jgi:hypothetical protein
MEVVAGAKCGSIDITAMNSKQGWFLTRSDGKSNIDVRLRYLPEVDTSATQMINFPQAHYTGNETCQMCDMALGGRGGGHGGNAGGTITKQMAYKHKNLCTTCRSHKTTFMHMHIRWIFKYCKGCCRLEHISFFDRPDASSCEDKQQKKKKWAAERRSREMLLPKKHA